MTDPDRTHELTPGLLPEARGGFKRRLIAGLGAVSERRTNINLRSRLEVVTSNLLLAVVAVTLPLTAGLFLLSPFLFPQWGINAFQAFATFVLPAAAAILFIDFGIKAAGLVATRSSRNVRRALVSVLAATCLLSVDRLHDGLLETWRGRTLGERVGQQAGRIGRLGSDMNSAIDIAASVARHVAADSGAFSTDLKQQIQQSLLRQMFSDQTIVGTTEPTTPYWVVVVDYAAPFVLSFGALLSLLLLDRRRDPQQAITSGRSGSD